MVSEVSCGEKKPVKKDRYTPAEGERRKDRMSQGGDVSSRSQQSVSAAPAQRVAAEPGLRANIQSLELFDRSGTMDRRFKRFHLASKLNVSSEENQVNTLIYCMGHEVDDIL